MGYVTISKSTWIYLGYILMVDAWLFICLVTSKPVLSLDAGVVFMKFHKSMYCLSWYFLVEVEFFLIDVFKDLKLAGYHLTLYMSV